MKSVGTILKHSREKRKISIEELMATTKIPREYIEAIEHDEFERLPSEVATRGFITLYASTVGVAEQSALAVYRRDKNTGERDTTSRLSRRFFVMGKKRLFSGFLWVLIGGMALGFTLYGLVILHNLRQAPPLTIRIPENQAHVVSPFIVRGQTLTDAVVEVDGEAVGVTQDGEFAKELDLAPGPHVITVRAKGRNGKENFEQRTITVDPQK